MRDSLFALIARPLVILAGVVWSAFPIYLIVSSSLKSQKDIFSVRPVWLFDPTLENYERLFREWPNFTTALVNSLIVVCGATTVTAITAVLAAYAYSRQQSKFLLASALGMIVLRMLPPIVVTIPLFPAINLMRLNDTHALLIFLYAAFFVSLSTWILKAFIDQIPKDLDEAAEVEGAGLWQVLVKIILPLSTQGLVAASVFVVIFAWNEYTFALVFTSNVAKTAPLIVAEISGAIDGIDWGVLFAAATVQLLPILLFVLAVQRLVVAGLTAGAVKG